MTSLKSMYDDYKNYKELGKKQNFHIKNHFSLDAMYTKMWELLDKYTPEFAQQVTLKLPQLKKIQLPTLKKIE